MANTSDERTCFRLARELREVAAKASPQNAAKYEAFAVRAESGEFDDYGSKYACPITQLYDELMAVGFTKFAKRVASGEFDATHEEAVVFWESPEGQEDLRRLSPELRLALFGEDPLKKAN